MAVLVREIYFLALPFVMSQGFRRLGTLLRDTGNSFSGFRAFPFRERRAMFSNSLEVNLSISVIVTISSKRMFFYSLII